MGAFALYVRVRLLTAALLLLCVFRLTEDLLKGLAGRARS